MIDVERKWLQPPQLVGDAVGEEAAGSLVECVRTREFGGETLGQRGRRRDGGGHDFSSGVAFRIRRLVATRKGAVW